MSVRLKIIDVLLLSAAGLALASLGWGALRVAQLERAELEWADAPASLRERMQGPHVTRLSVRMGEVTLRAQQRVTFELCATDGLLPARWENTLDFAVLRVEARELMLRLTLDAQHLGYVRRNAHGGCLLLGSGRLEHGGAYTVEALHRSELPPGTLSQLPLTAADTVPGPHPGSASTRSPAPSTAPSGAPAAAAGSPLATLGSPPATSGTPPATSGSPPATSDWPPPSAAPRATSGRQPATSGSPPPSAAPPATSGTPRATSGTPPATSGTPRATSGTPPATSGTPPATSGTPRATSGSPPPSAAPRATLDSPPPSAAARATSGSPPPSAAPPATSGSPPPSAARPATSSSPPPSGAPAAASAAPPAPPLSAAALDVPLQLRVLAKSDLLPLDRACVPAFGLAMLCILAIGLWRAQPTAPEPPPGDGQALTPRLACAFAALALFYLCSLLPSPGSTWTLAKGVLLWSVQIFTAVWFASRLSAGGASRMLGLVRPSSLRHAAANALLTWPLLIVVARLSLRLVPSTSEAPIQTFIAWPSGMLAAALLGILLPAAEELFFRGYLYAALLPLGRLFAAALSVGLFVAMHAEQSWGNWGGLVAIFAAGSLLSALRIITGSTWIAVLVHVAYNLTLSLTSIAAS